ncbi:MAG: hypothetical protein IJ523_04945 [Succinivibrionaceae bacterium]|nr:hypothetical protein [Succinivibrionaceae bacterium]
MSNRFTNPSMVFLGSQALASSADDIARLGKKALVVTGSSAIKTGSFQHLCELLHVHDASIYYTTQKESKKPCVTRVHR